jgi:hypothetical protein
MSCARAGCDDAAVSDRQRLNGAESGVYRQDLAARDNGVGVLLRERQGAREHGDNAEHDGPVIEPGTHHGCRLALTPERRSCSSAHRACRSHRDSGYLGV